MSIQYLALNFIVALFALINPIGNLPVFAAMTAGARPGARRRIAVYIGVFIIGLLGLFYLSGLALLQVFGISLSAFRIAGGAILFLLGLDMARNDLTGGDQNEELASLADHPSYARRLFERILVPFAIPILIGPGAISTVVMYASETRSMGLNAMAAGMGGICAAAVAVVAVLWATPLISRLLGRVGMTVTVRVLGLILCAMAVQFMIMGAADATHGFIRHEAARPYAPQ
ncbi:MarC family protein [Caulobacter endophyticus]|uniref:MarC family protein n=1 Tax=Caulobacter endophyticus TaxID=2172652 RepID=UPI0024104900|nr:MarC family protein [Caulobacter endophyticus]MDG2531563.1 MarC family protein [Caulobacter endophyticus]